MSVPPLTYASESSVSSEWEGSFGIDRSLESSQWDDSLGIDRSSGSSQWDGSLGIDQSSESSHWDGSFGIDRSSESEWDDNVEIDQRVNFDPFRPVPPPKASAKNGCASTEALCYTSPTTLSYQTSILNRLFCGSFEAAPSCTFGPRMLERCNVSSCGGGSTSQRGSKDRGKPVDPSGLYTEKLFSFLACVRSPINPWYSKNDDTKKPPAAVIPLPEDIMMQEMSEMKQLAHLAQNTAANRIRLGLKSSCDPLGPLVTLESIQGTEAVRQQQHCDSPSPQRKVRFQDPPISSVNRRPYFSEKEKAALFYTSSELRALQNDQEAALYWDSIEVVAH